MSDCPETIQRAAEAARDNPHDVNALVALARAYEQSGWYLQAAEAWARVREADPACGPAAEALARLEPLREAIAALPACTGRGEAAPATIRGEQDVLVVSLAGVLTPYDEHGPAQGLYEQVSQCLALAVHAGYRRCAVDMTRARFVSSYFLSVLVRWARLFTRAGGRLIVCGLHPEIETVFRVTRLVRALPIAANLGEALDRLRSPG